MIALIQLVSHAEVAVKQQIISKISRGILAFIGLEKSDTAQIASKLIDRILHYRIFPDDDGKSNLSLQDIGGGLLLVPQFTLVAETNKGTRPGFSKGMPPEEGKKLFEELLQRTKLQYANVEGGQFGAHMQITLCNDGPVTFILQS